MNKAEFDNFANEYRTLHAQNIAVSGETPDFFAEYKISDIASELKSRSAEPEHVLDFGAGVGNSVPWVGKYFPSARLTCVDVSERSIEVAAARFPGQATFMPFDGIRLPFEDATFDLAYAMCVFHHIDQGEHIDLLRDLRRTLRPRGTLVVFEHNPYNPLTVHAVNTCEFDVNAKLIAARNMKKRCFAAGFAQADIRYRLFFPHALARLRALEKYMTGIPFGAQYAIYAFGS